LMFSMYRFKVPIIVILFHFKTKIVVYSLTYQHNVMKLKTKNKYLFWMCFFLFLGNGTQLSSQKSVSVLGKEDYITIPFQYSQGFIVVDIIFCYLFPMRFIVDTGAEHTILFNKEYIEILKLQKDKEIKVVGADISANIRAWVVRKVPLQFMEGQKSIRDIIVLEEDIMNLGAITGFQIHGIIGVEFLKNFIADINYRENVIRLYKPDHPRDQWRKYEQIQLEVHNNKPYLKTTVSLSGLREKENTLLLDTGAALALLLHSELDSLQQLPSNIITGVIGKGIGGDLLGYSGKIGSIQVGKSKFENFVASFQSIDTLEGVEEKIKRDGTIGNYLLDQFHVIFDLPGNQLYLKKRTKKMKPVLFDKSGLIIYAFGSNFNKYFVHLVLDGSPGEKAGLKKGDIIKKIGIWPARFLTLHSINKKLSKENERINITVKRENQILKLPVFTKDAYEMKRK
jgi:hypothetical protein